MKIYPRILRGLLPAAHFIEGKKSSAYFKELKKSQWLKKEEIMSLQWKRLLTMIRHAYTNVPFYHRRFKENNLTPEDINRPSDLLELPTISKDDVRHAMTSREICARNISPSRFRRNSTGGSTGRPLTFYNDKIQLEYRWASTNRNLEWTGCRIGDRIIKLWSDSQYLAGSAGLRARVGNFLWRRKVLSAYRMDVQQMEKYVATIKEYKPKLIVGYASALYLLARFMEKEGVKDVHADAVISTAETLFPAYRKVMEDRFNCRVFNRYGTREFSTLVHECEEHSELHVNAENLFVEVVKDNEHAAPGESGEIIVTDLHNYCMPFIRYRIEDIGVASDESCSCNRGLPLLERVEGRVHDILIGEEGRFIPGEFFPHLFKDSRGIRQFQVIQERKDELLIRIVKTDYYQKEEMDKALAVVKQYFGENMVVRLESVEEIPLTKSGKFQYTICRLPIKFS